jgi:quinol monooxygenase YgiN
MSEVIVQGAFILDPNDRDRFVEASVESMRASRQEEGCLEYVMAVDPLDPERVVLSERWESMEHLQQHLAQPRTGARNTDGRPAPLDVQIAFYEATAARPLG